MGWFSALEFGQLNVSAAPCALAAALGHRMPLWVQEAQVMLRINSKTDLSSEIDVGNGPALPVTTTSLGSQICPSVRDLNIAV